MFVSYITTLVVILLLLLCIQYPVRAEDVLKTLPQTPEFARAVFQYVVEKKQKTDVVLKIFQADTLLPQSIRNKDSLNIVILFVQGVVWQKISSLFGYRDDARRNFEILTSLLSEQWKNYHPQFIQDILHYLREKAGLKPGHLGKVNTIENQFSVFQTGE